MRRMICVLAATALAAGPAFAGSLGLPNELLNGGFESGLNGNWVKSPTGATVRYTYGDYGIEAPPGGGGTRCGGIVTSWGGNWAGPVASVRQVVDEQQFPGWDPLGTQKEIDLQFDYALVSTGNPGAPDGEPWRDVELHVFLDYMTDGSYPYPGEPGYVRQEVFFAEQPGVKGRAPTVLAADWRHANVHLTLPIQPRYLSVEIEYHAHFAEWSFVTIDNVDLEARCIPEPATMGLLVLGLPLVRRRR